MSFITTTKIQSLIKQCIQLSGLFQSETIPSPPCLSGCSHSRRLQADRFVACLSVWVWLMFLQGQSQVVHLRQEHHRSDAVLFSHPSLICPLTDEIHFEPLIKTVSPRFLHCRVILFFLVVNKYFVGVTMKVNILYPCQVLNIFTHISKIRGFLFHSLVIICYCRDFMLLSSQVWPALAPFRWSLCLFDMCPSLFGYLFKLSSITNYSRIILYSPCPSAGISHSYEEP